MQLIDGVCQKHRPLVFLAGLLLVKEYAEEICHHVIAQLQSAPSDSAKVY
jgi:hypothetical protein